MVSSAWTYDSGSNHLCQPVRAVLTHTLCGSLGSDCVTWRMFLARPLFHSPHRSHCLSSPRQQFLPRLFSLSTLRSGAHPSLCAPARPWHPEGAQHRFHPALHAILKRLAWWVLSPMAGDEIKAQGGLVTCPMSRSNECAHPGFRGSSHTVLLLQPRASCFPASPSRGLSWPSLPPVHRGRVPSQMHTSLLQTEVHCPLHFDN